MTEEAPPALHLAPAVEAALVAVPQLLVVALYGGAWTVLPTAFAIALILARRWADPLQLAFGDALRVVLIAAVLVMPAAAWMGAVGWVSLVAATVLGIAASQLEGTASHVPTAPLGATEELYSARIELPVRRTASWILFLLASFLAPVFVGDPIPIPALLATAFGLVAMGALARDGRRCTLHLDPKQLVLETQRLGVPITIRAPWSEVSAHVRRGLVPTLHLRIGDEEHRILWGGQSAELDRVVQLLHTAKARASEPEPDVPPPAALQQLRGKGTET